MKKISLASKCEAYFYYLMSLEVRDKITTSEKIHRLKSYCKQCTHFKQNICELD